MDPTAETEPPTPRGALVFPVALFAIALFLLPFAVGFGGNRIVVGGYRLPIEAGVLAGAALPMLSVLAPRRLPARKLGVLGACTIALTTVLWGTFGRADVRDLQVYALFVLLAGAELAWARWAAPR